VLASRTRSSFATPAGARRPVVLLIVFGLFLVIVGVTTTAQSILESAHFLASLDGIVWAVPGLALAVPGLLLVLAVLAQVAAGAVWPPVVRRKLGSSRRAPDRERSA
jgi:hypothetical protein